MPLPDGTEYLRWSGLFEFLVSADGRRIAGRPLDLASLEALQTYLLGQVLSHTLIKLGLEPLHATVVVVGGKAVGFMGDSGRGKSSLAAAFLRAGHSLLTDDLLVVREQGRGFRAYPGLPRLKLFPEIARDLLGGLVAGTPMNNLTPKMVVPLDGSQHWRHPAPLEAIYVLTSPQRGTRTICRRLSRRGALMELLKNTYNRDVTDPERLRRQFDLTARVASRIPVKSLAFPRRLESLPAVSEAVLSDLLA